MKKFFFLAISFLLIARLSIADDVLIRRINNSGSGNFVQSVVDFGTSTDTASVTVIAQPWVTASSVIVCMPVGGTVDHPNGQEDVMVEGIMASVQNLVAGTGFDAVLYAPMGSWGQFKINCSGS